MREIKFIGNIKKKNDKRSYRYSSFECPYCKSIIERKTKDGLSAQYCSHKCYAKNREKRGAYQDQVIISGYIYKYSPDHPYKTNHNYVAEHRLVVEKILNRYLSYDEDVHHIDGDKFNNIPENLIVLSKKEHSALHRKNTKRDNYGRFTV